MAQNEPKNIRFLATQWHSLNRNQWHKPLRNRWHKTNQNSHKVIDHGNNMFIEEAEWYKALCYLKMNKRAEAKKELLAVIDRKGHYEKDAKAILRKLRYSFK